MRIATAFSTKLTTEEAVREAVMSLADQLTDLPNWLLVYASETYEADALLAALSHYAPDTQLHGATSCLGTMTQVGFHSVNGNGLALLGVVDEMGSYGVGSADLTSPRQAGADAILNAINNSGRMGEPPALVWLSGAPGHEEAILQGIQDVIGTNVPIAGGSSADNSVSGHWQQFANGETFTNAVVVTALYPSVPLHHAFHSGYSSTLTQGTITRANGRTLYEIDGQPAAELYNDWTGGAVAGALSAGGNVLSDTTLFPLGRRINTESDYTTFRLAHPDTVTADGALTLFANVEEGEELVLMSGTTESLVERAGRVAQSALWAGRISADQISGALVIYCAGCMLTVQDKMAAVVAEIKQALGDAPFIGTFTFGEQGCFNNGENHHGNLMISMVVFEK